MFLATALSEALALAGSPANELVVEAACTFVGPLENRELTAVDLHVVGRVPGLKSTTFAETAAAALVQARRSSGAREHIPGELRAELAPST